MPRIPRAAPMTAKKEKSIGQLTIDLASGNARTRKEAVTEIGNRKNPMPNVILRVAEADPEPEVRVAAIAAAAKTAINNIGNEEMVEEILGELIRIKMLDQFSNESSGVGDAALRQIELIMIAQRTASR
jgi:hypothetical protein